MDDWYIAGLNDSQKAQGIDGVTLLHPTGKYLLTIQRRESDGVFCTLSSEETMTVEKITWDQFYADYMAFSPAYIVRAVIGWAQTEINEHQKYARFSPSRELEAILAAWEANSC